MPNNRRVPSVMRTKWRGTSLTFFRLVLRSNHKLAQLLTDYPKHPELYVRTFMLQINGKHRKIVTYQNDNFGKDLREVHRMLAYVVRSSYTSSPSSYAYKEDLSVLNALEKHLGSSVFLKTDIHAYFDSIDFDTLLEYLFQKRPSLRRQKAFITQVLTTCFYEGHLPIGFISSPILSDLYLNNLDQQFSNIKGIQYTRYADDIIFSSKADNATEKLKIIQEKLSACLAEIHLELNKKKTYIRTLKQEGDAIHLLGLNLVKTSEKNNRITVSDRYIRKTCMELCELIREKDQIEKWELDERFCQVTGKIGYIQHASTGSAEKLKKMIRIKTGQEIELTYQSLARVCLNSRKYIPDIENTPHTEEEFNGFHSWLIPYRGRVHETVHLPAESSKRTIAALRYYLNGLCLAVESGISDIKIQHATLSIGEDIKETKGPQEIAAFREHVFKLHKSREEINYSAEYHYHNEKPVPPKSGSWNSIVPEKHLPIFTLTRIPAYGFIYDKEKNSWILIGQDKKTGKTAYNHQAMTPLENETLPDYSDWQGLFRMELRWPRATEAQLEEQIKDLCISLTKVPGIVAEEIDFAGRHFVCASEKHMTGAALQKLIDLLKEINVPVSQANGRNKMNGWFVPEDDPEPIAEPFYYLSFYCRVTGQMEISYFSYE